jgi:hypothetical protein
MTMMIKEQKMNNKQTRVLIEKDLDVIKPDEVVSCSGKILTYIENKDGIEKIMRGYQIQPYLNEEEINTCISCKNGPKGWVEFIDNKMQLQKKEGNVKVFLCLPIEEKAPKIDINISDMEL